MPKQRIATLIWKDGFGGAERSLCDLAAALDQDRFDMRFYYLSGKPGFFAEKIQQMGYQTRFLKWKSGFDLIGRIRLLKELKAFNPHVLHDHIIPPLTRPFLKIFLRKPVINTEHGSALQRSLGIGAEWRKMNERFDFCFCDFIAANSAASAEALKATYGICESKIDIVHLGIDMDRFKPVSGKQTAEDVLTIGYVGRIVNKLKGVDHLPFVAKHLTDQYDTKFKILIAGDGPDKQNVQQLCKGMGVENHFTFLGWVQEVKAFLQKIDVLLIPSRFESLGLTAIEALGMNVPVVAFDVQGLKEILAECPAGSLIKPGDTKGMAEAVYSLRNSYPQAGDSGRNFVAERFSNKKMARQYEAIYSFLIKN